jgi:outer membrane protein assembly factor BamB
MTELLLTFVLLLQTTGAPANESLWEAARAGDVARITAALDRGADVNAKSRYDVTPLTFAAGSGHLAAVKLLVERGADVNALDSFYRARAADMALSNGHSDVAIFLLQKGSKSGDSALISGAQSGNIELVKAALATGPNRQTLQTAIAVAEGGGRTAITPVIRAALDALPPEPVIPAFPLDPATLPRFAGTYRDAASGVAITFGIQNGALMATAPGQPTLTLVPTSERAFRATTNANLTFSFGERGGVMESVTLGTNSLTLLRAAATPPASPTPPTTAPAAPAPRPPAAVPADSGPRAPARPWPAFRGEGAAGNGDGQRAVSEWDVTSGKNIKWKTPIPGIANSSPLIWGDRVFVTTAVSKAGDKTFRTGAYGDVKPVEDLSDHEWKIYCLDKASGKILWERTAFSGAPKVKRHTKASQANSTPATDGRRVVAAFGSVGLLIAWDMSGKELWRQELGILDSGWFFDPSFQWGHASSPVIYRQSVILQADMQKGSYVAAWDLETGRQIWKTVRDNEISTWGTPALVPAGNGREELVTNGTKIRGYDPATGKLLWTLGPNSEVTVATPVAGHGLVFVTAGYPPVRPIYAIRPGATGDITLPAGSTSSNSIAWSNSNEGTYIPTPLVYGQYLYTMNNNGVVSAYNADTGERAFRGRAGAGDAFSASPIAADGRLYIASEDGKVYVVTAGPGLTPIATNDMNEVVMATPAISDGLIFIRTLGHVYGIGQ